MSNTTPTTTRQKIRAFIETQRDALPTPHPAALGFNDHMSNAKAEGAEKILNALEAEFAPAETVDFDDILEAIQVDNDYSLPPYWEDADGYEFTKVELNELPEEQAKQAAAKTRSGAIWSGDRYRPSRYVLRIENAQRGEWGSAYKGASKQVIREAQAVEVSRTLADLARTMREESNGQFQVFGEFQGYSASLSGVIGEWYARHETRYEIAEEIAAQMESDGYTITGRPTEQEETQAQKYKREKADRWKGSEPQTRDDNRLLDRWILTRGKSEYKARHARRHARRPMPRATRRELQAAN